MKKVLLVMAMVLFAASFVLAQDNLAQHNYVANGAAQGCRGCHIPHNGSVATAGTRQTVFGAGGADDPLSAQNILWDKNIVASTYGAYSSDRVNPTATPLTAPAVSSDPAWHSYLCFSCHDGTIAAINLPLSVQTNMTNQYDFLMTQSGIDMDLSNDHPVDVQMTPTITGYETAANIKACGGTLSTYGCSAANPLTLYTGNGKTDTVQCASCHNPHVQLTTLPAGVTRGNFLRIANYNDQMGLCRMCHLDKR